jgi:hypothetical protein
MNRYAGIVMLMALAVMMAGCELFQEITRETIPPPDPLTPDGTVKLFKQAADSNDIDRALQFLCTRDGKQMSALERFDYGDELARYVNRIHGRYIRVWDVSGSRSGADSVVTVNAEFDWLFFWKFRTRRMGDRWYISEIVEETP